MQKMEHNIILIGYMGAGKTSVGHRLAQHLTYQFKDTDHMIERNVKDTINHIFAIHGEEYFRDLETELLQQLVPNLKNTVLSTGGGLPLRKQNTKLLRELGYVVYLRASKDTILNRLHADTTRPLLQGEDPGKKIEAMLKIREPIYEKAAHKIISTDGLTITEIVQKVMENYQNLI